MSALLALSQTLAAMRAAVVARSTDGTIGQPVVVVADDTVDAATEQRLATTLLQNAQLSE